jgi:hypothetical protein
MGTAPTLRCPRRATTSSRAPEQSLLTPGLVQRYLDDVESLLSLVGDLQLNAHIWGE